MISLGLCIPTYNAANDLSKLLPVLDGIRDMFSEILFIDSSSTDQTRALLQEAGYSSIVINKGTFNHGGTRQLGVDRMAQCELIAFLTQDAIPEGRGSFDALIAEFADPAVAVAYGRQLPRPDAGAIERHARLFNYPDVHLVKDRSHISKMGIKAAQVSNSFAMYRRSTLMTLGGFPHNNFGEDMLIGAKAILAGYKVAYVGAARVFHSHSFTLLQEYARYREVGTFHRNQPWLLENFGKAESEGMRFVCSELKYLAQHDPLGIPKAIASTFVKYFGYKSVK